MKRILAVGAIAYAVSILAWHFYFTPFLDFKAVIGNSIIGVGGLGYLLMDGGSVILSFLKNRKVSLPSLSEKSNLDYLNEARGYIDALMKIGLDNKNDVITKSMVELNTELFNIYHSKQ